MLGRKWLSGKASVLKTEVPFVVRGSIPLLRGLGYSQVVRQRILAPSSGVRFLLPEIKSKKSFYFFRLN